MKFYKYLLLLLFTYSCQSETKLDENSKTPEKNKEVQNKQHFIHGLNNYDFGNYHYECIDTFSIKHNDGSDYNIYTLAFSKDTLMIYSGNHADLDSYISQFVGFSYNEELGSPMHEMILKKKKYIIEDIEFTYEIIYKNELFYWIKTNKETNVIEEIVIESNQRNGHDQLLQVYYLTEKISENSSIIKSILDITYHDNL